MPMITALNNTVDSHSPIPFHYSYPFFSLFQRRMINGADQRFTLICHTGECKIEYPDRNCYSSLFGGTLHFRVFFLAVSSVLKGSSFTFWAIGAALTSRSTVTGSYCFLQFVLIEVLRKCRFCANSDKHYKISDVYFKYIY